MNCPHCNKPVKLVAADADNTEGIEALLAKAEARTDLDEWATSFVSDQRARFNQYGEDIFMSEKQLDKLRKIANGTNKRPAGRRQPPPAFDQGVPEDDDIPY